MCKYFYPNCLLALVEGLLFRLCTRPLPMLNEIDRESMARRNCDGTHDCGETYLGSYLGT